MTVARDGRRGDDASSASPDTEPARAADRLVLPGPLWASICEHLAAELPNEGVGLLGARLVDEGDLLVATGTAFFPGRNRKASPTRYDLDVHDLVAALGSIEESGDVLGAIVHSHPRGAPTPSATDLAEAYYPEALMVIVSFAGSEPHVRAWRLTGRQDAWSPVEAPVEIRG
jgi:proteasome lid subunit RPN8/RPN11